MKNLIPKSIFTVIFVWFGLAIAQAENIKATSPNFTLTGEISEVQAIGLLENLEHFRHDLLDHHGKSTSLKDYQIDIIVVTDPDVFAILDQDESFIAFYYISMAGPRILINGNILSDFPEMLEHSLRHEYVHHFTTKHFGQAVPHWLGEGLADYYGGYQSLGPESYQWGIPNVQHEILATFPKEGWIYPHRVFSSLGGWERHASPKEIRKVKWDYTRNPDPVTLYYFQSWAYVQYAMQNENGLAKLDQLVEKTITAKSVTATAPGGEGSSDSKDGRVITALRETFNKGETEFQNAVNSFVTSGITLGQTHARKSPLPQISVNVSVLSDAEAAAKKFRLMAMVAKSSTIKGKMTELRDVITTDPNLAGSLMASEAAQDLMRGFNVKAQEKINQASTLAPNDPDIKRLKLEIGYQTLINENFMNASAFRTMLKPELAANPNDPELLVLMVASASREKSPPAEVIEAENRIKDLDIIRRRPQLANQLIGYYLEKENYTKALEIARRCLAFSDSNGYTSFQMERAVEDLERLISGETTY